MITILRYYLAIIIYKQMGIGWGVFHSLYFKKNDNFDLISFLLH